MLPTSKPPLDPPLHANVDGEQILVETRCCATAAKSSYDLFLFSFRAD